MLFSIRAFITGVMVLLCSSLPLPAVEQAPAEEADAHFSRREWRWAVKWINSELSFLMGQGVVKKIVSRKDYFEVIVGPPWYGVPFRQQGDFLKNLSRARQITGHSPFYTLRDAHTGEIAARITEQSITILIPGEGFFEYRPEGEKGENTVY